MRHLGALTLALVCAGACLAKEYSITESFDEDRGDDSTGGASSGGRGGSGGTVPEAGGEGGETGSGGTTGGTTGQGGEETGGSSAGGIAGTGATSGTGSGGRAVGGRGGTGGLSGAGAGGLSGAGSGGKSGGAGGTGGTGGAGTGGSGGTTACGACIVHRYTFNGTNSTATDSVGTAQGTIVGGTQSGGVVTLAGGVTDQYVSLPTSVLLGLTDVTLEFWVTWTGGTATWQRVFDFGSNDGLAGEQGSTNASSSYFFFTTRAQATSASAGCIESTAGLPRVTFTLAGPASETCVSALSAFPTSTTQVAVTIQGTTLSLYINGTASNNPATLPGTLANVTRTNNWLGRSQFQSDTEFAGTIHEFRVYSVARSSAQIAASNAAGPDTPPTQ